MTGVSVIGFFFFQAEDGIRDLVRSRGLGDVYKRQDQQFVADLVAEGVVDRLEVVQVDDRQGARRQAELCLLYTSDAADERSSVDLGGRRIIKKNKQQDSATRPVTTCKW